MTKKRRELREQFARMPELSEATLNSYLTDPSLRVRAALAENPALTEETFYTLSLDESSIVREGLAKNPETPEKILQQLVENNTEPVVQKLAVMNGKFTTEMFIRLLRENPHWDLYVAHNPYITSEVVEHMDLARCYQPLTLNEATSEKDLHVLYDQRMLPAFKYAYELIGNIANHHNSSPELLQEIFSNYEENAGVQSVLSQNPNTPKELLSGPLLDNCWNNWYLPLFSNPSLPPELLVDYMDHDNSLLRQVIHGNPCFPEKYLTSENLADSRKREGILMNPKTSSELLAEALNIIITDEKNGIQFYSGPLLFSIIQHPNTTTHMLTTISEMPRLDEELVKTLANHPLFPTYLLPSFLNTYSHMDNNHVLPVVVKRLHSPAVSTAEKQLLWFTYMNLNPESLGKEVAMIAPPFFQNYYQTTTRKQTV